MAEMLPHAAKRSKDSNDEEKANDAALPPRTRAALRTTTTLRRSRPSSRRGRFPGPSKGPAAECNKSRAGRRGSQRLWNAVEEVSLQSRGRERGKFTGYWRPCHVAARQPSAALEYREWLQDFVGIMARNMNCCVPIWESSTTT